MGETNSKVISFYSAKGGVGKTTSIANIAVALGKINVKVLLIDMDPIGSLSASFSIHEVDNCFKLLNTNYDYQLVNKVATNVDLIATSIDLGFKFNDSDYLNYQARLIDNLNVLKQHYDLILIDVASNFNLLNQLVLSVSDSLLLVVVCNQYCVNSISKSLAFIRKIQAEQNPNLKIEGVFINMFDKRISDSISYLSEINKIFNNDLYNTIIPIDINVTKLQKDNKVIVLNASWKPAATKYSELASEIYKKIKGVNH